MTDRTLPFIMLISPLGTVVNAKWADDERGYEKSVQRDKYPLIHGETAIDFAGGADAYDMTLIFDGPACDILAAQFYEATKELGPWMITHPVHGIVQLQLLSIRERVTPVSSGGRYEVETHWMEPLDPLTMMTMRQLTGAIDAQIALLASASAAAMAGGAVAGFGSIGSVVAVANVASAIASKVGSEIYYAGTVAASLAIAKEQDQSAQQDLANATTAAMGGASGYDPSAIATALFGVFQGPCLACPDATTAIRLMARAADDMIEALPSSRSRSDISRAEAIQVSLEAVLSAACMSTTIGNLQTRTQAIEAARALVQMFEDITSALDATYTLFQTNFRPDHRFYAQTETYEAALNLVASSVDYLIRQSFDLRIEKRFTLDRDKTTIQICVEEFGLKAEDELDNFIEWNELEGDDVMILAQSREVVVYVEPKK
jgi:hypothetical protein